MLINVIAISEDFSVCKALHQIGNKVAQFGVISPTQENPQI